MGKQRRSQKIHAEPSTPVNSIDWEPYAVDLYRAGIIPLTCITSNPGPSTRKPLIRHTPATPNRK